MSELIPDVKLFERLRKSAKVSVTDASKVLLNVTRTAYYDWLNGVPMQEHRYTRFTLALKALAMALKNDTLPVLGLTGKERRTATIKALREALRQVALGTKKPGA